MPIYEYRCPNGHTFEVFQRMTDPPASVCETCGAGPVEKLLFPVAVHFKGSGFYSTDYGRGSRKTAGKDAESGSGDSDGSAKTEQPDAKTDAKSSDAKSSDSKPSDSKSSDT
jgi:putative FmdB family regulatory protein